MRRKNRKIERDPGSGSEGRGQRLSKVSHIGKRVVLVAVSLMVFVVPLIYLPGIYDVVTPPKLLALHLCVGLACLGWALRSGGGLALRLISSPMQLPLLCFMGAAILSAPGSTHTLDTLVELLNQAALIILFFVVANTLSLHDFRPVLWSVAGAGMAVSVIGILQYHGLAFLGIPSAALPSATFGNRNFAASYLVCAIPLAGLLFLTHRSRAASLLSGLSTTLMAAFLVYTRTRSAWAGVLGALLFLGGLLAVWPGLRRPIAEAVRSGMVRGKGTMALGLLGLFVVLSVIPAHRTTFERRGLPYLAETKADIAATGASVFEADVGMEKRLAAWKGSSRLILDHPLRGAGPGGWKRTFPRYDQGVTTSEKDQMGNPHNDYIWIASEYGLVGLGIYLWFLVSGFTCLLAMARHPERVPRVAALMFALSLLSSLGDAFFNLPREWPQASVFPYLLFGIVASTTARRGEGHCPRALASVLLALVLAVSLIAAELSRRRLAFERHFLRAVYWGEPGRNWPALLDEARRSLEYGSFRPHILILKGDALKNLGRFPEAEAAYRTALGHDPYNWQVHQGLGTLFLLQGRLDEAEVHFRTAVSLCPSSTESRNNLGVIHLHKGDLDRAEQGFRAVLQNSPDNAGAHLNLGTILMSMGQPDSAAVYYERAVQIDPESPKARFTLAQAYQRQGRLHDALPHYLKARPAYSQDANFQWGLGLALEADGQLEEAGTAYRKVIALRPDFGRARLALGNVTFALGNYSEAMKAYRTFLGGHGEESTLVTFARKRIAQCEENLRR